MSDSPEVGQIIKDILISVGFSEDVDTHANLFMFKINNLAFDMYMKGLPQTAADLVLSEVMNRTQDEQRFAFITELLSKGENQHFLLESAQQVAQEFSTLVNQES